MKKEIPKGNPRIPAVLAEIEDKAARAAQAHADQQAAFKEDKEVEIALLHQVIEIVKPALPSICSKREWATRVAGPLVGGLWIAETGVFARFMNGTAEALSLATMVEEYDPLAIIEQLADLLERQASGRTHSTQVAERHAAKLRAILTLLED